MKPERPEFYLEPPPKGGKKRRYLPEGVAGLEIAPPLERSITVIVLLKDRRGRLVRVPVDWSPLTGQTKRMHPLTWAQLGVSDGLSKIRNAVIRAAKREHARRILMYSTPDMYDGQEV